MRRRFAWKLAATALVAGALTSPARAQVISTPMFIGRAVTADGLDIGTVRVQLDVNQGRFRVGGQTWACEYAFNVDFLSTAEAFLTGFQPHTCGQSYLLDPFAGDASWSTSTYVDGATRQAKYEISPPERGLEGYSGTTFTGHSNAGPQPGRVTITGVIKRSGVWYAWTAEIQGVTFGCEMRPTPPDPVLSLGLSSSANPVGTGETMTAVIRLDNTGGWQAEGVRVTLDPVAHATYEAGSTTIDGEPIDDADDSNPLTAGLVVDVPAGTSVAIAQTLSVDRGTGQQGLDLAAHAALEGFPRVDGKLHVKTFERAPSLGVSLSASKDPIGTGEVLTATLRVTNNGNEEGHGIRVKLDSVANASYVAGSTIVNGAPVKDAGSANPLTGGVVVDVPVGGSATITQAMMVNRGTGDQGLDLTANAVQEGFDPAQGTLHVATFERRPILAMSVAASKNPIGTGEVLTATLRVENMGNEAGNGVRVTLDPSANGIYIPNSTRVNGVAVQDVNGESPLAEGAQVDLPEGGAATITCDLLLKTGTGGQVLKLAGHASVERSPDANATLDVNTFETVVAPQEEEPTIPKLFLDLYGHIEKARKDGAYRFRSMGYPKFMGLTDASKKAWDKKDKKGAVKQLDQVVFYATWKGRYDNWPELFQPKMADYAKRIETAARKLIDLIRGS